MSMEPDLVLVAGAGHMGAGIAQVCLRAGYRVELVDVDRDLVERGAAGIRRRLGRDVEKGRVREAEVESALARLGTSTDLARGAAAFLAVEAIVEDLQAKLDLWRRLDAICAPGALLASNTSSVSITRLAAATARPERFVGLHFFNPAPLMPLVEVVRGLATSEAAVAEARAVAERLGKTAVEALDSPGFIANRLLLPMINEAVFALMEGVAGPAAIDQAARLGLNHPMGPLRLADLIGLDTCLAILEVLQRDLGDPKYRPCPLLRRYVAAGRLGQKSGRGFYDYGG